MAVQAAPCEGYRSDGGRCKRRTHNTDRYCGYCNGGERPTLEVLPMDVRRSITDRIKNAAKADPSWSVNHRYRYIAFDRLLTRLFTDAADSWILKGGVALMARIAVARPSDDLDLAYIKGGLDNALADLRRAAATDMGDQFAFTIGDPSALIEGNARGLRVPVVTTLADRSWVKFHIDLTAWNGHLPDQPQWVAPLVPVDIPGLRKVSYRCWPLVNHIADKVAACYEQHGPDKLASSRYRDLADLYLIATTSNVDSVALRSAILGEFQRRQLVVPARFLVPDPLNWRAGWIRRLAPTNRTLAQAGYDQAVKLVSDWLAPVLAGPTNCRWNAETTDWVPTPAPMLARA